MIEHADLEVVGGRQSLDHAEEQIDEVLRLGLRLDDEQLVIGVADPAAARGAERARAAERGQHAHRPVEGRDLARGAEIDDVGLADRLAERRLIGRDLRGDRVRAGEVCLGGADGGPQVCALR